MKRRDADAGDARARTCDQRRADVLAQLVRAALATGEVGDGLWLGTEHGRLVAVQVTVPLTTLAGLSEEPGELAGYGPIPARVACELAAAGVWQWLGTDPVNGAVLSHGRTRYTPTHDLIEHVLLRDRTCKAPGCALPATRCDLDHVRAYASGGATCAGNLTPLCRKHHLIKHHGPFMVDQPEPGTLRWTSPTGNTTIVGPARVGPVHDPPGPDDPPF
ncbi:HNH endonuclease [Jiangella aurantiaca]|uniref:HNH endonuclease n=1 Tax=Jiangella aurantiaca TaxID=2530373 RepID=A0A4V2YRD1_9ACTN|nr:HNH endonuclease [Jiangella aurantiaca]